ncbi:transposase [Streptomyces sp. NPDC007905]|uniref:transposase n=1 Tax=Streptomyces sp. NPDC007905 TaxID=3364788 RepID=UPI0036E01B25
MLSEAQGIPPGRRCVGGEHPRQPGPQASREGDAGHAVPARTAPPAPGKLRADKAYHSADALAWLRKRGITARIAPPGIEASERLGRHRWKIERSISWLFGHRHLTVRYERKGSHFLAFPGLAAALTCYKKLSRRGRAAGHRCGLPLPKPDHRSGSGAIDQARVTGACSSVTQPSRFSGHSRLISRGYPVDW